MKKLLLLLLVIAILGAIYYFFFYSKTGNGSSRNGSAVNSSLEAPVQTDLSVGNSHLSEKMLRISTSKGKNYDFQVEVAQTHEELGRGLMYRTSLSENRGMLFIFPATEVQKFWMKNTLISLDIIFIGEDYKVVHIAKDAQPCTKKNCDIYTSVLPARYVLEIKGGLSDKIGLKEGDKVSW